jgi:hypothetical protein
LSSKWAGYVVCKGEVKNKTIIFVIKTLMDNTTQERQEKMGE